MQRLSKPVRIWIVLCAAAALGLAACADVPQEAVELSDLVSQDMAEMQRAHRDLATVYFDQNRQTINNFIDNTYSPALTQEALTRPDSNLGGRTFIELLRDTSRVPDNQALKLMQGFVSKQQRETEAKRRELLEPLEQQRRDYMAAIDASYQRMERGYSVIAGHLASIRQIQVAQEEILKDVGLEEIRETVSSALVSLSDDIAEITSKAESRADSIDEIFAKADAVRESFDDLKEKLKERRAKITSR